MSKWYLGTVIKNQLIAKDVSGLVLHVPDWPGHQAGQHCEIRLTAPDGYQAGRDYSLASPPSEDKTIEFGVQLLPDGEVSPYLCSLQPGQQVEISNPIGGHFIWEASQQGALCLIGGGSGIVPLMSMLRHAINLHDTRPIVFLISARAPEYVLYLAELTEIQNTYPSITIVTTLTDSQPKNWPGYARRIDPPMIAEVFSHLKKSDANFYICGPTPFVETVANHLTELNYPATNIKTERFGGMGK